MSQSNFVFGALFVAFLVYITAKGELPTYLQLMTGTGSTDTSAASAKQSPTGAIGGAMTGGSSLWDKILGGLKAPGAITGLPFLP